MTRIFHHYEKWECLAMYLPYSGNASHEDLLQQYAEFLKDSLRFTSALRRVMQEWPIACEQFLTNESINRIAWLGQASMCIETGIPRKYRAGFMLLTKKEQEQANYIAQCALDEWEKTYGEKNSSLHQYMVGARLF